MATMSISPISRGSSPCGSRRRTGLRQAFRNVNLNTDVTLNFNLINGDVNNDNLIGDADLLRVLFAFGQRCDDCPEDLNGDGMVDDADLLIVLFNFGRQGD